MTAYRLHFEPGTLDAIEKIRNGELGELVAFTSCFGQKLDPDNHRAKHGLEAGPLFDMAPYPINAIRYLFGAEPVAVESAVATRQPSAGLGDLDDTFAVVLRMPGDKLASFTVSYAMNDVDSLIVAGMKGSIHMSPAYGFQSAIEQNVTIGDEKSHEAFKHTDHFGGEMRYFSDCILNDRDPEPDVEEGLSDLRVIEGIKQALKTGGRVELPPFTRTRRIDPASQRQTLSAVDRARAGQGQVAHWRQLIIIYSLLGSGMTGSIVTLPMTIDVTSGSRSWTTGTNSFANGPMASGKPKASRMGATASIGKWNANWPMPTPHRPIPSLQTADKPQAAEPAPQPKAAVTRRKSSKLTSPAGTEVTASPQAEARKRAAKTE
jgi:hypothetical protein